MTLNLKTAMQPRSASVQLNQFIYTVNTLLFFFTYEFSLYPCFSWAINRNKAYAKIVFALFSLFTRVATRRSDYYTYMVADYNCYVDISEKNLRKAKKRNL
jgi:hypothetical protein